MPSTSELAGRLAGVVDTQQAVLASVTDIDEVMSLVVEKVPEVTGGSGAVIEMVEGDELVYRAASGEAREHLGMRLRRAGSLSGRAVQDRAIMRCDDTEADPRVDGPACRAIGIRSMIIAPLFEGDTAVGALKSFSSEPNAFTDLDMYVLQLLAGMTSAALVQARTFREHLASEARYRLLFDRNVSGVFRSTLDGQILDCNDALVEFLGFDSREDLMARPSWDLYHDRADREELLRDLQSRRVLNSRIPFRRKDGTTLLAIFSANLVPDQEGGMQLLGTLTEA